MFYANNNTKTVFKNPPNRQLKVTGWVERESLANPDCFDSNGEPCLIVLKDGNTSDVTVGRYAGLEAYLCDELGQESRELAIYNYNKQSGDFSAKGDSGSLSSTAWATCSEFCTLACPKARAAMSRTSCPPGGLSSRSKPCIPTPTSSALSGRSSVISVLDCLLVSSFLTPHPFVYIADDIEACALPSRSTASSFCDVLPSTIPPPFSFCDCSRFLNSLLP